MKRSSEIITDLPSAKTAAAGAVQSVFVVSDLCPINALTNMAKITPARASDPFFSWTDKTSAIRPMTKEKVLARINTVLQAWGWRTAFGHSFRIGGVFFHFAEGKDPEHIRIAGRWKSLAYQVYVRAHCQSPPCKYANQLHSANSRSPMILCIFFFRLLSFWLGWHRNGAASVFVGCG